MNKTLAGIIKLLIPRAKTEHEFVMLLSFIDDLWVYEVITDFSVIDDLKTQIIGAAYIEWLESNETEENK